MLVECEPAIKSILVHIDSTHHNEFIIEDLDETHLFVKETMLHLLKQKLEEVSWLRTCPGSLPSSSSIRGLMICGAAPQGDVPAGGAVGG